MWARNCPTPPPHIWSASARPSSAADRDVGPAGGEVMSSADGLSVSVAQGSPRFCAASPPPTCSQWVTARSAPSRITSLSAN